MISYPYYRDFSTQGYSYLSLGPLSGFYAFFNPVKSAFFNIYDGDTIKNITITATNKSVKVEHTESFTSSYFDSRNTEYKWLAIGY